MVSAFDLIFEKPFHAMCAVMSSPWSMSQARIMKVTMTSRPSICQECGHAAQQRIQEEAEYLR